jgi:hypothetical protein
MIVIEILAVVAVISMLFGFFPGLQAWLKNEPPIAPPLPPLQQQPLPHVPNRLMARLVQPDPFPATVSSALPLTVMVLTVGNGTFTPEAGATVYFSVARGNAAVNGSGASTQTTDRLGMATAQLTMVRSGRDELMMSVTLRGTSMAVSAPIYFETLG